MTVTVSALQDPVKPLEEHVAVNVYELVDIGFTSTDAEVPPI